MKVSALVDEIVETVDGWDLDLLIAFAKGTIRDNLLNMPVDEVIQEYNGLFSDCVSLADID